MLRDQKLLLRTYARTYDGYERSDWSTDESFSHGFTPFQAPYFLKTYPFVLSAKNYKNVFGRWHMYALRHKTLISNMETLEKPRFYCVIV